jgi:diguanylate cyclase
MDIHGTLVKVYISNVGIMIMITLFCNLVNKYALHRSTRELKQFLFVGSCIAAGWVSMLFGMELQPGVVLNLRFIPLIIAPMFISSSIPLLLIAAGIGAGSLVYGFSTASLSEFGSMLLLGLVSIVLNKQLRRTSWSLAGRLALSTITINVCVVVSITVLGSLQSKQWIWTTMPVAFVLSVVTSALFVFIIRDFQLEYVRRASLVEEASRDHLTKLYNVRTFDRYFQEIMKQAARDGNPVSLAFIDVDHFKTINDTYGHAVGDVVLRKVAELMATNIRWNDFVARYGGEEFVVILPDTNEQEAIEIMDRLRISIAEQTVRIQKDLVSVTVSIGIATYPASSEEELIHCADQALYQAKAQGRNQVLHIQREKSGFEK